MKAASSARRCAPAPLARLTISPRMTAESSTPRACATARLYAPRFALNCATVIDSVALNLTFACPPPRVTRWAFPLKSVESSLDPGPLRRGIFGIRSADRRLGAEILWVTRAMHSETHLAAGSAGASCRRIEREGCTRPA
eukprot:1091340-Rhodomonas_salina.2